MPFYHFKSDGTVREITHDEYWLQVKRNEWRKNKRLLVHIIPEKDYLYASKGKASICINLRQLRQVMKL